MSPNSLRLPAWFAVWFVIALGLFGRESCRQVFRWLAPNRQGGTPGRSTAVRGATPIGNGALRRLYEAVVVLLGRPDTPGTFYGGLQSMRGEWTLVCLTHHLLSRFRHGALAIG